MLSKIISGLVAFLGLVAWLLPDISREYRIIITLSFVIGGLVVYLVWQQIAIKTSNGLICERGLIGELGIRRIYRRPKEKPVENAISQAKTLYFIAYAGNNFIQEHRESFIDALRNGASIFVLIGSKDSEFIKEIELMEDMEVADKPYLNYAIDTVCNEFKRIRKLSESTRGKIEIRAFNTEFRNSITMCEDKNGKVTAWLTIMFGYKRAGDSMMIEFCNGDGVNDCMRYFEKMWSLRRNTVLYDSTRQGVETL